MTAMDLRRTIAVARRMLYREGCDSAIAGHVSGRRSGGDEFLISPFEYFDQTMPSSVVPFPVHATPTVGDAPGVSPAVQFHAAIYQARPDVGSVIHTHARYTAVVSSTGRPVGMFNAVSTLFAGRQAVYVDDGTLPSAHGPAVTEALGACSVVFLKNHGAVIVGPTVERTTILALALEQACRFQVECAIVGGTEICESEVLQAQADYDRYFCDAMWRANVDRLRRSDPEVFLEELADEVS
jgi:L-fuculose-phosphate aldolase